MSSTASIASLCAGELIIDLRPDAWVYYEGTPAQLIDEGLIPTAFEWPRAAARKNWKADGFEYSLHRNRPKGHKGPMRSWLELDNWLLRVDVAGRDGWWIHNRRLDLQAKELEAGRYSLTAAGRRESEAHFRRVWAADRDSAFQRFKLLVPGLVTPKRGRKPRVEGQGAEARE